MICLMDIDPNFERNLLYAIHNNFSLEKMKKILIVISLPLGFASFNFL